VPASVSSSSRWPSACDIASVGSRVGSPEINSRPGTLLKIIATTAPAAWAFCIFSMNVMSPPRWMSAILPSTSTPSKSSTLPKPA
jgi:hypothetical protein